MVKVTDSLTNSVLDFVHRLKVIKSLPAVHGAFLAFGVRGALLFHSVSTQANFHHDDIVQFQLPDVDLRQERLVPQRLARVVDSFEFGRLRWLALARSDVHPARGLDLRGAELLCNLS